MWTFFKLLFSKNYWRLLFRGHTWRETMLALRRVHKDKRARKQLRMALLLIFTPFLCLFYIAWMLSPAGGYGFGLVAVLIGFGIASILRRARQREDSAPLTLNPRPPVEHAEKPVPEGVRKALGELTLLHAILTNRAGSESFLRTKELPPELEVTTRRNQVALLREHGMWDRLGAEERDLLMLPDGHWPVSEINRVALLLDPLRVLRWTVRIDAFLPTVGSTLQLDYRMSRGIVDDPTEALEGDKLVSLDDLEIAQRAANAYFQRCAAEGVKRGLFEPESEENAAWSREYSERMAGQESEDLLLGTTIVSAAEDGLVQFATVMSLRRLRLTNWLLAVFRGEVELGTELKAL